MTGEDMVGWGGVKEVVKSLYLSQEDAQLWKKCRKMISGHLAYPGLPGNYYYYYCFMAITQDNCVSQHRQLRTGGF